MGRAGLSERIDAPAAAVWDLVRWDNETSLIDSGAFARVEYEERRPIAGARRWLHPAEGAPIQEQLESVAADEMRYTYRVIDAGPMPLDEYVGEVRITAESANACRLDVACTFTPLGITDEQWTAIYISMQQQLVAYMREVLVCGSL